MVLNLENVPESPGRPVKTQICSFWFTGSEWFALVTSSQMLLMLVVQGLDLREALARLCIIPGVGPCNLCFTEASRWFWCTLKFENHWYSGEKHEGTDSHSVPDYTIYQSDDKVQWQTSRTSASLREPREGLWFRIPLTLPLSPWPLVERAVSPANPGSVFYSLTLQGTEGCLNLGIREVFTNTSAITKIK